MYYIADSESGIKEFSSILNNNHFNADPRYNYAWKNPVLAILKDCIVSLTKELLIFTLMMNLLVLFLLLMDLLV